MVLGGAHGPEFVAGAPRHFAWQAPLGRDLSPGRRATLRGRRGTTWHPPWYHVAGVAQTHIYRRFAWQACHLWYWVAPLGRNLSPGRRATLRGRRGTTWHPPSFHVAGVAQSHIYRRFAWQAWHLWYWVAPLGRDLSPGRRATLRGRRGTIWHPPWYHVASVAQTHIYRRFAWQAWHLWYWVAPLGRDLSPGRRATLRGRRGTIWHPPWYHVAGVAQSHIYRRFAWQACHLWYWVAPLGRNLSPGRRATLRGRRGTTWHPPSFHVAGVAQSHIYRLCVAGVAQPDIHLDITWQAWHNLTSTVVLRGRRGTYGTGWRPWAGICRRGAAPLCVAGVAQPDIHLRFTWQAWHNLTSTVVSRGRRGTYGTGWRPWAGICRLGAAPLCVAGVAQPDIHLRFTWQAWHNLTSTVVLRGRRGTNGTGWRPWAGICRLGAAPLCVAGVAQPDIHLDITWQAWHKLTSTVVLHGRRATYGTGWRPWAGICRRGAAPLCVAGVAQPDIHLRFTWQAWHNLTSTVFAWQAWHSWVFWPVYACHVPACLMVAPACCLFRPVFVFASFVLLACLRMLCSSMFDGRSGMFYFPICFLLFPTCFVRGRSGMFAACLSSGMFLLSACFGMFDFGMFPSTHTHLRPGAGLARGRYDRRGPDRFCFLHAGFHHVVLVVLGPTRSCRQQL